MRDIGCCVVLSDECDDYQVMPGQLLSGRLQ